MENKDNTTSVFTYIWTLENSPALLFSAPVESPVFQVESVEKTKWCLGIWTSKDDIYLYVQREKEDNGPDSIGIDFEIALLSVDGSPLIEKIDKKEFKRSEYVKLEEFAKNDEVFAKRRKEFLPKDILTVRCRMWKSDTKVSSADLCFANTRLGIDRQTFLWTIREFSNFKLGQRKTHYLKSTAKTGPELYLTLFLTQKDGEEYVHIKVDRGFVEKKFFISGEISLLNVEGKVEYAREIEDWFSSPKRNFYEFEEFITKAKLMENESSLLPNDVLCLKCVFEICLGEVSSHIENGTFQQNSRLFSRKGGIFTIIIQTQESSYLFPLLFGLRQFEKKTKSQLSCPPLKLP
ncbi:TD and POZ domain-containing protein 4 [Caerostris darwini]|uniref:TD and POZ domain-containing protein 4 n=1 Tax=Caerostris darwini TaxID=1538125 RepID=A0AAV4PJQ2_9ARAC|nr:TD and POZ domain-containing protein 4 [Caerostris darwini]